MNNRKRVDERTEPWEIPLLIVVGEEQWLSTTTTIDDEINVQKEG